VNLRTTGGVTTATLSTTMLPVGAHTITASYSGDTGFLASSATLAGGEMVNPASTSTAVSSTVNPSVTGQSVTFTATVSVAAPGSGMPTGMVTFSDGSTSLGQGTLSTSNGTTTASFSTSSLAVGTHTITASYSGDHDFLASSGTLVGGQVITPIGSTPTTTTVGSNVSAAVFGQTITFTATVSPANPGTGTPTGTVQFQVDGSNAGNPVKLTTSSGVTSASFSTATLAVGTHTVAASYSGDSTFANSNASTAQTVNKAATSTLVTTSANPVAVGQSLTFTATILAAAQATGMPSGTVLFQIDGSSVGSPVAVTTAGTATTASFSTSTLTGGTHTVTATYSGDNNFAGSSGTLAGGQVIKQPSNPAFVTQVYQDLLNRPPDPVGFNTFVAALNQGASRTQVTWVILGSPEYYTDLVESYYEQFLGRAADAAGLNAALQFLFAGGTDEELEISMVSSAEYYQVRGGGTNAGYLNALYRDVLGRAIDSSGQTAFTQALADGSSRAQVAAVVFGSTEYLQDLVQGYYQRFLQRPADSGGLNGFVTDLQTGATNEMVIAAIISSDEYFLRT
jgi:hypothetical protein